MLEVRKQLAMVVLKAAMSAVVAHLGAQPSQRAMVLAVTDEGQELRVHRHEGPEAAPGGVSVSVEVPEVPQGSVHIVLCRWVGEPGVLAYTSLDGGASRPEWSRLNTRPGGMELVVKWATEPEPRTYRFRWLPENRPA